MIRAVWGSSSEPSSASDRRGMVSTSHATSELKRIGRLPSTTEMVSKAPLLLAGTLLVLLSFLLLVFLCMAFSLVVGTGKSDSRGCNSRFGHGFLLYHFL